MDSFPVVESRKRSAPVTMAGIKMVRRSEIVTGRRNTGEADNTRGDDDRALREGEDVEAGRWEHEA